jgi:hypothetical protein
MRRKWQARIRTTILLLLALVLLLNAWPLYLYATQGRPMCWPSLGSVGSRLRTVLSPQVEPPAGERSTAPDLPAPEEWADYGTVLESGEEGEWDFLWAGTTPASVVKKDGTYFFYYVAGDGYRALDGDARHRAIGVATSTDGVRFQKYEGNPIMTHQPYGGEEEGANSAGVTLDQDGRFVMVYGAAAGPRNGIVADARYAFSDDGLTFTDAGQALYHCDVGLYGAGDELFPVAVLRQEERWVVYYHPNGVPGSQRTLGAAWGPSLEQLTYSAPVLDGDDGVLPANGWGNIIALDEETLVHFGQWQWWPDTFAEVRLSSPEAPHQLSEPLFRYGIPDLKRGVAFLDKERRTWFMYYNDFSRFWHLKLAPYGLPDSTPPSVPERLRATATAHDRVELAWHAATDDETGVVEYRVYRDGTLLGSSREPLWIDVDSDLAERQQYRYAVSAVNFHGAESASGEVVVTTTADRTPPAIAHVTATGDLSVVRVTFDEAVEAQTASDHTAYTISGGVTVQQATVAEDGRTVLLQTTPHEPGGIYSLQVEGVVDRAGRPNMLEVASRRYTASAVPGLYGRWLAWEESELGEDLSGYGIDGMVHGPVPDASRPTGAAFDGMDDYLQIPGSGHLQALTGDSFTMSAWVRPQATGHLARIFGRVAEHPAAFSGLSFTPENQFQATVSLEDETQVAVTSPAVGLERWAHVAMVVDVDAGELHLYIDSEPVEGSPQPLGSALVKLGVDNVRDERSGAYFIGSTMPDRGAGAFYDAYFHGAVSDVRLYGRALSAVEIQAIRQE